MTKTFRVVARARATAIMRDGDSFEMSYELDGRCVALTFRTRYLDRDGVRIPGQLWFDAVGEAADLNSALGVFTNAGRDMAAWLSIGANAAIAPLEAELAFDVTPNIAKHEYFQRYLAPDDFAYTSRFFDVYAIAGLVDAVATSPHRERLTRAVSQYSEALSCWRLGSELPALSHLFIGVEAIKTALLKTTLTNRALTAEQLGEEWGFKTGGRLTLDAFLTQEARVRLVYQGDNECHRRAKEVSDAFEHGFKNAGALYEPAARSLVATANYLRSAIFDVAGISGSARKALLSEPFTRPRGPAGVDTYIRASLEGEDVNLAAQGSEYPHFVWTTGLKNIRLDNKTGKYQFDPVHNFTAVIAAEAAFKEFRLEAWDASVFDPPGWLPKK